MEKQGFLVLERRPGESIIIDGGRIEIVVWEVRGDRVRIATRAPGILVDRKEVHDRREAKSS